MVEMPRKMKHATAHPLISKRGDPNHHVLALKPSTRKALLSRNQSSYTSSTTLRLILDNGCTRHVDPHERDLVNRRPTRETMSGIEDRPSAVTCIGDLPVVATDSKGRKRRLVIQGVRCVPNFTETLISVDSLWEDSRSEVRFADHLPTTARSCGRDDDGNLIWLQRSSCDRGPAKKCATLRRSLDFHHTTTASPP